MRPNKRTWTWQNISEGLFDRLGARPLGIIVFTLSVLALLWVTDTSLGKVNAPAIASGPRSEHPAPVESYVARTHVRVGDSVDVGSPLVTLSGTSLQRQLDRVDAEIRRVGGLSLVGQADAWLEAMDRQWGQQVDVERARLAVDEAEAVEEHAERLARLNREHVDAIRERVDRRLVQAQDLDEADLEGSSAEALARQGTHLLRASQDYLGRLVTLAEEHGSPPDLPSSWASYYEAELEALAVQRAAYLEDLQNLTIRATVPGRVAMVLPEGAPATIGLSIASVVPDRPTEIVAYLDPSESPEVILPGTEVRILSDTTRCSERAAVLRRGAMVDMAPPSMNDVLDRPTWGWPVYISVPEGCLVGVGQKLSVQFALHHP